MKGSWSATVVLSWCLLPQHPTQLGWSASFQHQWVGIDPYVHFFSIDTLISSGRVFVCCSLNTFCIHSGKEGITHFIVLSWGYCIHPVFYYAHCCAKPATHWQVAKFSTQGKNSSLCENFRITLPRLHHRVPTSLLMSRPITRALYLTMLTTWSNPTSQHHGPIPTFHHHGQTPNSTVCLNGRQPNCLPTLSKVNFQLTCFSKSSNSPDHCIRAWHSSPISYLGFIMTIVIVISFPHEHKLYPMLCTWTKSWIVQSPTKLNDKI